MAFLFRNLGLAVLILGLLALFACSGGGGRAYISDGGFDGPDAPGGLEPPPEYPRDFAEFAKAVIEPQLPANADVGTAALEGKVSVFGYTLLPLDRIPVQITEPGMNPISNLVTRIIDDEDNIGDAKYPDNLGEFFYSGLPAVPNLQLVLDAKVAEDLDGDLKTGDTLSFKIPVSFLPGKVSRISVSIAPVRPEFYLFEGESEDAVRGRVVGLSYEFSGPEGTRRKRHALNFRTARTVLDTNDDGVFNASDIVGIDTDKNAIEDTAPALGAADQPVAEIVSAFAIVREVRPGRLLVKPLEPETAEFLVLIDFRTSILSPDGMPLPPSIITESSLVLLYGFMEPSVGFVAQTVVVFPPGLFPPKEPVGPGVPPGGARM
ncbi:MAG: hypothetical protein HRF49_05040 [bacterium]|jgi:hypothetical protein